MKRRQRKYRYSLWLACNLWSRSPTTAVFLPDGPSQVPPRFHCHSPCLFSLFTPFPPIGFAYWPLRGVFPSGYGFIGLQSWVVFLRGIKRRPVRWPWRAIHIQMGREKKKWGNFGLGGREPNLGPKLYRGSAAISFSFSFFLYFIVAWIVCFLLWSSNYLSVVLCFQMHR